MTNLYLVMDAQGHELQTVEAENENHAVVVMLKKLEAASWS